MTSKRWLKIADSTLSTFGCTARSHSVCPPPTNSKGASQGSQSLDSNHSILLASWSDDTTWR